MEEIIRQTLSVGFIFGGAPIALFNAVVLVGILRKKSLRSSYTMIAFMIFNGAVTGALLVAVGSLRIVYYRLADSGIMVTASKLYCITDTVFVALLFFNLMNGIGLLMLNLDRAAAVLMPIFYFRKHVLLMSVLVSVSVISSGSLISAAVVATVLSPGDNVDRICRQFDTVNFNFYVAIVTTRTLCATLAICVMLSVVVVLLVKRAKVLNAQSRSSDNIQLFRERQRKMTYTTILSCKITLVLSVIPSLVQLYLCFVNKELLRTVSPFTMSLSFLNCVNEALIFLIRQEAIRSSVFELLLYIPSQRLRKMISNKISDEGNSSAQQSKMYTAARTNTAVIALNGHNKF